MAHRGWDVVGVDFSDTAIEAACRKLEDEKIPGVSFHRADATRLDDRAGIKGPFDFVLDIGCFHGVEPARRDAYVNGVAALTAPGAVFMIFAWGPAARPPWRHPTREREIRKRFAGTFELVEIELGKEPKGAAWFTLRRREGTP